MIKEKKPCFAPSFCKQKDMNLYVVNVIFSSDSTFLFSGSKSKRRESIRRKDIKRMLDLILPNGRMEGAEGEIGGYFRCFKDNREIFRTERWNPKTSMEISGRWGYFSLDVRKHTIFDYDTFEMILYFNDCKKHGVGFTLGFEQEYDPFDSTCQEILSEYEFSSFPFYRKKNILCRTFTVPRIDYIFYWDD